MLTSIRNNLAYPESKRVDVFSIIVKSGQLYWPMFANASCARFVYLTL